MKKRYGTLAALSALTASLALPATEAEAQKIPVQQPTTSTQSPVGILSSDIDRLQDQCDYIWDNRTNFELLTAELNRLLNNSPEARTCDEPMSPEMRQTCEEQCTGLILALLGGGDPIARVPNGPPEARFPGGPVADTPEGPPIVLDDTDGY
jgi:hypothetical protein